MFWPMQCSLQGWWWSDKRKQFTGKVPKVVSYLKKWKCFDLISILYFQCWPECSDQCSAVCKVDDDPTKENNLREKCQKLRWKLRQPFALKFSFIHLSWKVIFFSKDWLNLTNCHIFKTLYQHGFCLLRQVPINALHYRTSKTQNQPGLKDHLKLLVTI